MLSSRIPRAATYLRFGFTNLCGDRNSRCDFRFFSPGYRIVLYAGHIRRNRMLGHSNVRNVGRGDRSVCGHRFFALPLHPCKEKPCFSGKFREIKLYRIMYWTLELASKLEDAPWPATKDELIDYAVRSGAPSKCSKTCRR